MPKRRKRKTRKFIDYYGDKYVKNFQDEKEKKGKSEKAEK